MSYLLDSDWIIQTLHGVPVAATVLQRLSRDRIFVSYITLAKMYEKAFESSNPEAHLDSFRGFIRPFQKLTLDEPTVERFAEIRAYLRRRGEIISDFDILIAATALRHDLTLLTFNIRHLSRVPDLKLYQPG